MRIQTSRFGELEIESDKILFFPEPFLGLPDSQQYVLLETGADSPFKWLQSCEEPDIALVVTDPEIFFADYEVTLRMEDISHLQVEDGEELKVMVVLVVPSDPRKITANLMAPVIINLNKRLAGQIILADSRYSTRHLIFPTLANQPAAGAEAAPQPDLARVSGGFK